MSVRFHPPALERRRERDVAEEQVRATVEKGEQFPAKFGRTGFRRNFQLTENGGGSTTRSSKWKFLLFGRMRPGG